MSKDVERLTIEVKKETDLNQRIQKVNSIFI